MFIFDILVYVIFAMIMCNLAKRSYSLNPSGKKWDKYLIGFIVFYTFICAIRWNVGVDSVAYAYEFKYGSTRTEDEMNGEYLFWGLQKLFSELHLHFIFGMGICAFFQIFFMSKALKEYKYILVTLPIALFGSRYFLDLNNGVRQMIVASIFVYASKYIVEKKMWHYIIWIVLASTIHHSSLMLLPFYLLPNKLKMADKRIMMLIIFAVCFIAGQTPAFQNFISFAEKLSALFGYERYTDFVGDVIAEEQTSESLSFGPIMLSFLLISIFTIWFGPKLNKKYGQAIPYFNLWYNLSFFYSCAYFLICNISHLFIRPVQYFELFQLIIISLLLYDLGLSQVRNKILHAILIIILWTSTSWNIIKADISGSKWESSTYKVFFMHQDQIDAFFKRYRLR